MTLLGCRVVAIVANSDYRTSTHNAITDWEPESLGSHWIEEKVQACDDIASLICWMHWGKSAQCRTARKIPFSTFARISVPVPYLVRL